MTEKTVDGDFDLIIEPHRTTADFIRELIHYRELFFFLAWRDIIVRYKQTAIGIVWSLIRPLLSMVIFTLVFGRVAKLPSEGVPYPILVYSAMLPWQYFSSALGTSAASLLNGGALVSKIYFPRLILPAASILLNAVDFLISFGLLCVLMLCYRFIPSPMIILLPLFFLPATLAALGLGCWFSALSVKYRDFQFVVPFMLQFGLFISPVGFSSSIIPERLRLLYSLNPMVGVIDGFRWCIQGTTVLYLPAVFLSIVISLLVFLSGIWFFRRIERSFADFI
ncbi:MAG: ABC transporter permease [Fretibacterium sp.]|nr:ABC transporter permease [Fretibacterium sp.]